MKTLAPGGKALLRKALAAIKAYPKSFHMDGWLDHDPVVKRPRKPYCGTTACLAGHIVLAAGFSPSTSSLFEIATLPASLRPLAKKATTYIERDFVSIRELATYLVVGGNSDRRDEMEAALFYGRDRTPAEIARTVDTWLASA